MAKSRAEQPSATRIIERSEGDLLVARCARLSVVRGPDKGRTLRIEGRPIVVGTAPTAELALTDTAASGEHFSIESTEAGFLLRDLGSTNGTFVDGYRAGLIYLPATAQIEAGESRMKFDTTREELEIPLSSRTRFGDLLGHSPPMRQVFAVLERVAPSESTLLLEGESGTGKELAARAVHQASPRAQALFVTVDCGALPAGLIESELFGHLKGSFTGATADKAGLFEEANGGTLFLDEIGELPLELQPKLLRALETRAVRRVGEAKPRPIDVRLIAATNRNLAQESEEGRFRKDLYFRLSVIRVRLPALRERIEELPRLVAHFAGQLGRDPTQRLSDSVMSMLRAHRWPGNIRELRNVVERLLLVPGMSPGFYFGGDAASETAEALPPSAPTDLPFHEAKQQWTERFEREYLSRLLAQCRGNISEAARVSGLSRQSYHRLLNRYGLDR